MDKQPIAWDIQAKKVRKTNRNNSKNLLGEPAQSMRPLNERIGPDAPFDGVTTHRNDYIERHNEREKPCPAEVVLNKK